MFVLNDTKERLVHEGMQSQPCGAILESVLIGEVHDNAGCMSEVISRHTVIFHRFLRCCLSHRGSSFDVANDHMRCLVRGR